VQGFREEDLEESGGTCVVAEALGWGVLGLEQVLVWFVWEVDRATAKEYSKVWLGPEVRGIRPEVPR
jgi:hypothetical protein